jgi:hypothetical protein
MQRLEGAHAEVRAVRRDVEVAGVDRQLAGLADLELQVEAEGGGEDIEPRPQVRRGGGNADETAPGGQPRLTST